jgi:hypothetical protein
MSEHLKKDCGDLAMQSRSVSVRRAMRTQGKQDVAREDGSLGTVTSRLARTGSSEQSLLKGSTTAGNQDPLFLFASHLEWSHRQNLGAYQELVAALDDSDKRIRAIAEMLLHRSSPRPQRERPGVLPK